MFQKRIEIQNGVFSSKLEGRVGYHWALSAVSKKGSDNISNIFFPKKLKSRHELTSPHKYICPNSHYKHMFCLKKCVSASQKNIRGVRKHVSMRGLSS